MQEIVTNPAQTQQWSFILQQLFAWVMAGLAWIVPFQPRVFGFILQGENFWRLAAIAVLFLLPVPPLSAGFWGTTVSLSNTPFHLGSTNVVLPARISAR